MTDILDRILARKAQEVAERSARQPLAELQAHCADLPPPRGFAAAMEARIDTGRPAVIAEIKKASPSKGVIRDDFDPTRIARSYAAAGAACLSVLTDAHFFQGSETFLRQARAACKLPALRKDFIVDPWQVWESRRIGADCILLIVAALEDARLQALAGLAAEVGLDVLVEVHDAEELERALSVPARLVGINNRDLHSFRTSLEVSIELSEAVPYDRIVVSESGIRTPADVERLRDAGIEAFLVGEAFMRSADPGAELERLFAAT